MLLLVAGDLGPGHTGAFKTANVHGYNRLIPLKSPGSVVSLAGAK